MDLLVLTFFAFLSSLVKGLPPRPDECCMEKMVGGVPYRFIREAPTSAYECLNNCLYEDVNVPGSIFCFAEGDLEVVCEDERPPRPTSLPPRPSKRPPKPTGIPPIPPRPSDLPPRPSDLPPRPSDLPPRPSDLPPRPSDLPPRPSDLPPIPSDLPPRPSVLPPRPPRPSDLPPRPSDLPPRPSDLAPRPSDLPPRPSDLPPRPSDLPPRPSGLPSRPSGQPPRPSLEPPTEVPEPSATSASSASEGGDSNTLTVNQIWSQEPNGFSRTAVYSVPDNSQSDAKYPVVIDLHGNGGQANLLRSGYLSSTCVIVAPQGYERSWNIYSEKSKAPDVDFITDLITKIGFEIPQADTSDITLLGTSNGAGLIYRLLIEVENPRPFKRVIPMVSSLFNKQYHDNSFWKPSVTSNTDDNNYDTAVVPSSPGPQLIHFHGTEDGTVPYLGEGGNFLGEDVDFLSAQESDFLWAKAFGYGGDQIDDADGEATANSEMIKYSYLDGAVTHYKLKGAGHNAFHPDFRTDVQNLIKDAISG